jgi:two-component system cell cycle sensor histidine kinase/response regulator CckA
VHFIAGTHGAALRGMTARRALVADDDPELLALVSSAVATLGFAVTSAVSGDELLQTIAEIGPFDLVITDVSMPWMSGLQVMHSVRTAGLQCPVIVMTALRDATTSGQVSALGVEVQLLHKPFSMRQLESAVNRALAPSRVAS